MTRKFDGTKLVIASHNQGKIVEIGALLAPYRVEALSAGALGLPEPEETEPTFEGNAALKARAAVNATGLPALADDSGLVVPALGGAPGIYSARWAGPSRDFTLAMTRVHTELERQGQQRVVCLGADAGQARRRGSVVPRRGARPSLMAAARR